MNIWLTKDGNGITVWFRRKPKKGLTDKNYYNRSIQSYSFKVDLFFLMDFNIKIKEGEILELEDIELKVKVIENVAQPQERSEDGK